MLHCEFKFAGWWFYTFVLLINLIITIKMYFLRYKFSNLAKWVNNESRWSTLSHFNIQKIIIRAPQSITIHSYITFIDVLFFFRSQGGGMFGDVNISAILDSFSLSYDKRVRPNYGGECYHGFDILLSLH